MFHSFFPYQARSRYSSLFSLSFIFILLSEKTAKSTIRQVLLFFFFFFFFTIIRSGRLAKIRCSICILKSQRILFVSFFRTNSELCIYHVFMSVLGFPILFHFLQKVWYRSCTLGGWSFLAICRLCIRL